MSVQCMCLLSCEEEGEGGNERGGGGEVGQMVTMVALNRESVIQ